MEVALYLAKNRSSSQRSREKVRSESLREVNLAQENYKVPASFGLLDTRGWDGGIEDTYTP